MCLTQYCRLYTQSSEGHIIRWRWRKKIRLIDVCWSAVSVKCLYAKSSLVFTKSSLVHSPCVAQQKCSGPMTQRLVDQKHPLLTFLNLLPSLLLLHNSFYCTWIFALLKFGCYSATVRSTIKFTFLALMSSKTFRQRFTSTHTQRECLAICPV